MAHKGNQIRNETSVVEGERTYTRSIRMVECSVCWLVGNAAGQLALIRMFLNKKVF